MCRWNLFRLKSSYMISAFECVCCFIIHLHEVQAADGECILFSILQSAIVSAGQMLFISLVYIWSNFRRAVYFSATSSASIRHNSCVCAPFRLHIMYSQRKSVDDLIRNRSCISCETWLRSRATQHKIIPSWRTLYAIVWIGSLYSSGFGLNQFRLFVVSSSRKQPYTYKSERVYRFGHL